MPAARRTGQRRADSSSSDRGARVLKLGACRIRFDRPRVMGIINNTPDSFSCDGVAGDIDLAVSRALSMFESGADLVDVGGESTRPGAEAVPEMTEMDRTIPIIEALAGRYPSRISIDTMKPSVADRALYAGASIVNDVSGLRRKEMIGVVAQHGAGVIIMHMKGDPRTMQIRPRYGDVIQEIMGFLNDRISAAEEGGVDPRLMMVDPGIGFGKNLDHNLEILARLGELKALGKPIVIGVSRKSFIGRITGSPPDQRLDGSLAAAVLAVMEGADIVRVHDVPETVRALRVYQSIRLKTERRKPVRC